MQGKFTASRGTAAREILSRISISRVYSALSAESGIETPPIRGRRAVAFWRNGDGHNVALDDETNTYYDHARAEGGGVLALVQTVRACSKQEALFWIADLAGMRLSSSLNTSASRRKRQQRARAGSDARKMWARDRECVASLRWARDQYLRAYHRAQRYIIEHSLEGPISVLAADVWELYGQRYQEFDQHIERMIHCDFQTLKLAFRRLQREESAHV